MIDLKPFCGTDETRPYLLAPYSVGEYTYATNGHVMIRVPRRDDAAEQKAEIGGKAIQWDKPLEGLDAATFSPLSHRPLASIPKPSTVDCDGCNGRGRDHDCPDCECICDWCDGSGKDSVRQSTTIRGAIYDLNYVRMILSLPGVAFANETGKEAPLLFKFDGGVGAVMPRRAEAKDHFEIEADKAA